tara:strand:- start:1959 stop:3167 length:1209 start_codon:yes stop_codon:yes gene_type:complete
MVGPVFATEAGLFSANLSLVAVVGITLSVFAATLCTFLCLFKCFYAEHWKIVDGTCKKFVLVNVVAGVFHVAAAVVILALGEENWPSHNRAVANSWTHVTLWRFMCYDRTNASYIINTTNCSDDDKMFFPDDNFDTFTQVHIILLCTLFSAWSGAVHLARAWFIAIDKTGNADTFWDTDTKVRFAGDYAISASIMLACFSVLYGATNIFSTFVGPAVLAILLFMSVACLKEYRATSFACEKTFAFSSLCSAYVAVLVASVGNAVYRITHVEDTDSYGEAPLDVLLASSIITVAVFSIFIIPYAYELYFTPSKGPSTALQLTLTSVYCFMSLAAKVVLHVVFVTTGLSQSKLLANNTDDPPPDPQAQLRDLAIASSAVVTTSFFIFFVLYRCVLRQKSPKKRI